MRDEWNTVFERAISMQLPKMEPCGDEFWREHMRRVEEMPRWKQWLLFGFSVEATDEE